jgi:hypothetical protein
MLLSLLGYVIYTNVVMKHCALIMETANTSETFFNIYQTTRLNNAEDSHLQSRCCLCDRLKRSLKKYSLSESLKSPCFKQSLTIGVSSFVQADLVYTRFAQSLSIRTTGYREYVHLFMNVTIQYNIQNKYCYPPSYKTFNCKNMIRFTRII